MTEHEFFRIHGAQWKEWCAVRDDLLDRRDADKSRTTPLITAHQVTTELRKRMLARGERLVTLDDVDSVSPIRK